MSYKPWIYMAGSTTIQDPSEILNSKLQFWFDNTQLSDGAVTTQNDETGNFKRVSTGAADPNVSSGIITYNGTNNVLTLQTIGGGSPSGILDDTQGFVLIVFNNSTVDSRMIAAADTAGNQHNLRMGQFSNAAAILTDRNSGSNNNVAGTIMGTTGALTYRSWSSNGSRYQFYNKADIDAVSSGTDDGDWFGDNGAFDNITFGAMVDNNPNYYAYSEKHVVYMSEEPTAGELSSLQTWATSVL